MAGVVDSQLCELGNWQNAIDKIWHEVSKRGDLTTFRECADDSERIKFVHEREYLRSIAWLESYLDECGHVERKSSVKAKHYRNDGNKEFQRKKFDQAFELYTQSVLFAPADSEVSTDLALALGNRSAVLYHLGKFEECIVDIELSLRAGFPDENAHKLFQRKGQCLLRLERIQASKLEFRKALDILQKKEKVDKDKIDEITEWLGKTEISEPVWTIDQGPETVVPVVSYGANSVVIQASAAVSLRYNTLQGRHLVATRTIHKGDTLIVERPFAAVLLPDQYTTHCHHCFDTIKVAYPCIECSSVRYCSVLCQTTSWQVYHQYECHYLDLLHSVGIAHLSLRVLLVAGLHSLKDFRQRLDDAGPRTECRAVAGLNKAGKYERDYLAVYHLMPHTEHILTDDLFQYALTAALLGRILQDSHFFDTGGQLSNSQRVTEDYDWLKDADSVTNRKSSGKLIEEFGDKMAAINVDNNHTTCNSEVVRFIQGLLLRHIQQLVCNAHAITELQVSQVNDSDIVDERSQVRIATAIYLTASLMNHSCDPTIIPSFHKDMLVVRSVKDVNEGGEIFSCYGPHCNRMGRRERQEVLRGQYFFTCTCEACMGEEKTVFQALRCVSCDGPVCKVESVLTCDWCGQTTDGVQEKTDVQHAQTLFIEALEQINQGNVHSALQSVEKCYDIQSRVMYKHNRDLAQTKDCLARCWAMLGVFDKSSSFLESSISTTRLVYGAESVEMGHELHKLAEVHFNGHQVEKALSVIDQSLKILKIHCSDSNPNVAELEQMKSCLLEFRSDTNNSS